MATVDSPVGGRVIEKGKDAARFLAAPSMALALWLLSAMVAQLLVAVALALFDARVDGFTANIEAWYDQGGAATLSIGLLAAAMADTMLRGTSSARAHFILAILGTGVIIYVASEHGDVLRGQGTRDEVRSVSAGILLAAAVLGGATAFLNSLYDQQRKRTGQTMTGGAR